MVSWWPTSAHVGDALTGTQDPGQYPGAQSALDLTMRCCAPQDAFISFLLRMQETHSCLETMQKMERWIMEHRADPRGSRLVRAEAKGVSV